MKRSIFISHKKAVGHKAKPAWAYIGALGTKKILGRNRLNLENSAELNSKRPS